MRIMLKAAVFTAAMLSIASASHASTLACLITGAETDPFYAKMKEGALAKGSEVGIDVHVNHSAEGVIGQVVAIDDCIAAGAKGILIVPFGSEALSGAVKKAREAGVLVIALDSPFRDADAAFAPDYFKAGMLMGAWTKYRLDANAAGAKIVFLNRNQVTNEAFIKGFGGNFNNIGYDTNNVCLGAFDGSEESGRKAMESCLIQEPNTNVVYAASERAAMGAYAAIKAAGRDKQVLIMSRDGGCSSIKNVANGFFGATSQQFPQLMASKGIEAIRKFADTGERPMNSPGKDFFDMGVTLVTRDGSILEPSPICQIDPSLCEEVPAIEALKNCW